ncbi:MAG: class I tRNA ligase family protein [Pseudomonadota bacterium]
MIKLGADSLSLLNTMSRKKELFRPVIHDRVKIFTCGPSIYQEAHIGNYRTFLFEDILQRYLEYSGYKVNRVINFTDVEDKSIAQAQVEKTSLFELTDSIADRFIKTAEALKIKLPPSIPRSSTTVDESVSLIKTLLKKGYAYYLGNDIFFDPLKFNGFGKLYRLDMRRWPKNKIRFSKDTYIGQRWNLGDFVLWHGKRDGDDVFWDTAIGKGRPAWNVQDGAVIVSQLGLPIDIACGGVDNLCRHHDYNIAITESASGKELAHYWLHGEHLLVGGKKMSKSKGSIIYIGDILKKGFTARQIRFYLIYGHYRKRINFSWNSFQSACLRLDEFDEMTGRLYKVRSSAYISSIRKRFEERMNDDMDVQGSFDGLYEIMKKIASSGEADGLTCGTGDMLGDELKRIDSVLQILTEQRI